MPRGIKKEINYEEEIKLLDEKIKKYKNLISEVTEQKKQLIEQKKQSKIQELINCIETSGKSIDDVIKQISA